MYQNSILFKTLKITGISLVLGSILLVPLAAMEQGPDEQEQKNISKQIASYADNLTEQWKQQQKNRIILAGHNIDTKQENFISPLVNKIVFHGLKNIPEMDTLNLSNIAAYIMHKIGTYAAKNSTYNQDGSGLMIVYPEPKDAPRVQTFEGSNSADDSPIVGEDRFGEEKITCHFENKIVFSKNTEEQLDQMAKAIATSIKEINNFDLGKFLVDQKEFPPNYNAKKQSPVAPCHFPHKLKKSSDEKTLGKNNNIELVLQMKNIEKLIIGNVTFCYYDNYFGPY